MLRPSRHKLGLVALSLLMLSACGNRGGPRPPRDLTYPDATPTYQVGAPIPENRPTFTGSANLFFVHPALPDGLSLHPSTGVITGTPSLTQAATDYAVTGRSSAGHTTAVLSIEIQTNRFAFSTSKADNTILGYVVDGDQLLFNGHTAAEVGEFGPSESDPGAPLVSPDGAFLYVPNDGSANVSVYAIDATTGKLTAGAPTAVGTGPQTMILNGDGSIAWVASAGSDELRTFSVNGTTGDLTPVGAALTTDSEPVALALSPDGSFLFVAAAGGSGSVQAHAVGGDGTPTVSGTPWPASTSRPSQLAMAPNGETLLVTVDLFDGFLTSLSVHDLDGSLSLVEVQLTGGAAADLVILSSGTAALVVVNDGAVQKLIAVPLNGDGSLGTPVEETLEGGPVNLVVSGLRAYVTSADDGEVDLYDLDPSTGVPTFTRSFRTRGAPSGFALAGATSALAPRAAHLYTVNTGSDDVSAFEVNPANGMLTQGNGAPVGPSPRSIVLDPLGEFAWVACPGSFTPGTPPAVAEITICSVDATTGDLTNTFSHSLRYVHPLDGFVAYDDLFGLCANSSGSRLYAVVWGWAWDSPTKDWALQGLFLDTYVVDRDTGEFLSRIRLEVSPDARARNVVMDPTGRFLFVATEENNSTIETFAIDPITGFPVPTALGMITNSGSNDVALRFSPSGAQVLVAYDASNIHILFSAVINPVTGLLTLDGFHDTGLGTAPQVCEVDPSGTFAYVAVRETGNDHVSSLDFDEPTGSLSNESAATGGLSPADLRVDPTGRFLWVANEGGDDISLYAIDETTGLLTLTGTVSTGTGPAAIGMRVVLE